MKKTVIIIAGPTAVGKTSVGIRLARQFGTAIISADSRQCYREMKIGVARPSEAELAEVPHYFIATHSIHEEVTAVTFEQYALDVLERLFREHDVVFMVGGTGLYLRAFTEGLDAIPAIPTKIRDEVISGYTQHGPGWLDSELRIKDPQFAASGEMLNPQRMMRALEIIESTGKSILSYQQGIRKQRDFRVLKIGLELPREELLGRIDTRVDQMLAEGLLNEVDALRPFRDLRPLNTVGYAEFFMGMDQEQAVEQVRVHTRQYAKRQMTWFRKDPDMKWFNPGEVEKMQTFIFASL